MHGPQFMMVRPKGGNLHSIVAQKNTCFFDICLPNYSNTDVRRFITYFKEVPHPNEIDSAQADTFDFADDTRNLSKVIQNHRLLRFDATPPKMPVNFEITDLLYRGEFKTF